MMFLHLGNLHSTNVGNGALICGTERVLREDLGTQGAIFRREAWDDYTISGGAKRFDQRFVDVINQESDALLVGAAVTLNGSRQYTHAGMRLDLPLALWSSIKRPIIIYGISYRMWPRQRYTHVNRLQRVMAHLLGDQQALVSVRNDGTKEWLESLLGYASDRITAIPDPALYVPTEDAVHPELVPGKTNVLVSLNEEDCVHRFGGRSRAMAWRAFSPFVRESALTKAWSFTPAWRAYRWRFLRRLAKALERIASEWDANVILSPHDQEDFRMMGDFLTICQTGPLQRRVVATRLTRAMGAPQFYDLYAKADAVVSMRVHSMVPAIGLGTPVVGLVSQARMERYMADAGLTEFTINIWEREFEQRLFGMLNRLLTQRAGVCQRLSEARSTMRARSAAFHSRIDAHVRGPGSTGRAAVRPDGIQVGVE